MRVRGHRLLASALVAIAIFVCAGAPAALAASVTPVPHLDFERMRTTWYVAARLPIRKQKKCTGNEVVLYALADKKDTFQIVTQCVIKEPETMWWDSNGKLDPHGTGALKLPWLWIFSRKYWVLAVDPDYKWAIVGRPNRKALWLLSRTPAPDQTVVDGMKSQAAAMGFDTAKLIMIRHTAVMSASSAPGAAGTSAPTPTGKPEIK